MFVCICTLEENLEGPTNVAKSKLVVLGLASYQNQKDFFFEGTNMSDQFGCLNLLNIFDNDPSRSDIFLYIYLQI